MTSISASILETRGLRFAYPKRPDLRFPDIILGAGDSIGLIGPSGSGKSTLLMLIAGLLDPHEGQIVVAGETLGDKTGRQRDRFRGRTIGVVLQSFRLLGRMTVLENLTTAQYLSGAGADILAARSVLAALDIADLAQERPGRLSRGQAQRAAIARALVNRPKLVLADEPTSSLDDEAADAALHLLLTACNRLGAALLVATHDSRVKSAMRNIVPLHRQAAS